MLLDFPFCIIHTKDSWAVSRSARCVLVYNAPLRLSCGVKRENDNAYCTVNFKQQAVEKIEIWLHVDFGCARPGAGRLHAHGRTSAACAYIGLDATRHTDCR